MEVRIINKYKKILFLLALIFLFSLVTACSGHDVVRIKSIMQEHLFKKYGEEFVVDRIGTRRFGDKEFYQARIYPKEIIGTPKEGDSYYYAKANIDILPLGRLREPGDTYAKVLVRKRAEEYLMPKVKKLFGGRVKLKPEISYYTRNKYEAMVGYITPDFKGALKKSLNDPENNRLELELYIYIFDRIDDREEKEKRRKDIFEFVQYLKEEGLFKYLELGVIFIDERVLAPSYDKYQNKVFYSEKVEKVIEGEKVRLPPLELRKEMSQELEEEIDDMSEKELLINMKEIRKDELSYRDLDKYYATHYNFIYSVEILKNKYNSSYQKYKKEETLNHYYYKKESEIKIGRNLEYILK